MTTTPPETGLSTQVRPPAAVTPPVRPAFEGFAGAAAAPFSDEARAILAAPVDPRDVEIRTDGIVFLSGVWYRRQLIRAFGAGGWAIVPRTPPQKMGEMVVYHGALIVLGRFVAEATGECETRAKMTYASSLEGARTDCITRCCKDLGMASELWDPSWRKGWIRDCAYQDGGKWYKNDGSEHDMEPLFQKREAEDAEAREAYRATVGESAGPKAPSVPGAKASPLGTSNAPAGAPAATTPSSNVTAPRTATAPTAAKRYGAGDIIHDGTPATAAQVKMLHVLRGQVPKYAATPDDPRSDWKKMLGVYRGPAVGDCKACKGSGKGKTAGAKCRECQGHGKERPRIEHSNELSVDGASHLIARMEDIVRGHAEATAEIRGGGANEFSDISVADLGLRDSTEFEDLAPSVSPGGAGEREGAAAMAAGHAQGVRPDAPVMPPPPNGIPITDETAEEIKGVIRDKQLTTQMVRGMLNNWFGVVLTDVRAMLPKLTQTQGFVFLELLKSAGSRFYEPFLAEQRALGNVRPAGREERI